MGYKQITKTKYIKTKMKTFITALLLSVALIDTSTQGANAVQIEFEPPTKMEMKALAKMDQEEIDQFTEEKFGNPDNLDVLGMSDFCLWCTMICFSTHVCPVWCWWCPIDWV